VPSEDRDTERDDDDGCRAEPQQDHEDGEHDDEAELKGASEGDAGGSRQGRERSRRRHARHLSELVGRRTQYVERLVIDEVLDDGG
jgi:hypothetical protein